VAADSRAVVEEVKHGKYQMVLLDVSPPADASIDLLEQIRAADSDICVITMTAMPSVAVAVRAMKRQAFDYLQKPLADEELRHVIDAAIREKGLLVDIETRLNQIISQIELGKSAASMSTLHKLATALQVKMTYFFETV
jgi:DNA-binding NtrC family response regulator